MWLVKLPLSKKKEPTQPTAPAPNYTVSTMAGASSSSPSSSPSLTTPTSVPLSNVSTPSTIRGSCAIRAPHSVARLVPGACDPHTWIHLFVHTEGDVCHSRASTCSARSRRLLVRASPRAADSTSAAACAAARARARARSRLLCTGPESLRVHRNTRRSRVPQPCSTRTALFLFGIYTLFGRPFFSSCSRRASPRKHTRIIARTDDRRRTTRRAVRRRG